MNLFLKNKSVFIVGAGSYSQDSNIIGIGTAIAESFAREEVKQIIFSYNASTKGAIRLERSIKRLSPKTKVLKFKVDLSTASKNSPKLLLGKTTKSDIFIYSAGIRFYKKHLTLDEKKQTNLIPREFPTCKGGGVSKELPPVAHMVH
jgi:short-subunit dehydrogenase